MVARAGNTRDTGLDPWVRKTHWSSKWQPTSVFLPGKFHGQWSLAGCSPWGCKESDTTEHTHIVKLMSQWPHVAGSSMISADIRGSPCYLIFQIYYSSWGVKNAQPSIPDIYF